VDYIRCKTGVGLVQSVNGWAESPVVTDLRLAAPPAIGSTTAAPSVASNIVNGIYDPQGYQTGGGSNGIVNAFTAGASAVLVPPTYTGTESVIAVAMPDRTSLQALGGGNNVQVYWNFGAEAGNIPGDVTRTAKQIYCGDNGIPGDVGNSDEGHGCEHMNFSDWFPGYDIGNPSIPGLEIGNIASGHVNVSGTTVTWADGTTFTSPCGTLTCWNTISMTLTTGGQNLIYQITSCASTTSCTLATSPGTLTDVAYQVGGLAGWTGSFIEKYDSDSYNQGIHQVIAIGGGFFGSGDKQLINIGTAVKPAAIAASDQGSYGIYNQSFEAPMWSGTVTTGGTGVTSLAVNNNHGAGPRAPLLDLATKISGCTGTFVSSSGGLATVDLSGGGCASSAASFEGNVPLEIDIGLIPDNRTNAPTSRTFTINCTANCGTGLTTSDVLYFGQGILFESVKPTSVGTYSGTSSSGTQQITASFRFSHLPNEQFCSGGFAGYYYDQTTFDVGGYHYMHNVVCSLSTTRVLMGYMVPNLIRNGIVTGPGDLYQGADVTYVSDDGVTVGVEDNNVAWTSSDNLWNPNLASQIWEGIVNYTRNEDPYAATQGIDQQLIGNGWLGVPIVNTTNKYQNTFNYLPATQSYQGAGGTYITPIFAGIGTSNPGAGPYAGLFDMEYDPVGEVGGTGYLLRTQGEIAGTTQHCFSLWEQRDQTSSIAYCHDTQEMTIQATVGGIALEGSQVSTNNFTPVTLNDGLNVARGGCTGCVSGTVGYIPVITPGNATGDSPLDSGITLAGIVNSTQEIRAPNFSGGLSNGNGITIIGAYPGVIPLTGSAQFLMPSYNYGGGANGGGGQVWMHGENAAGYLLVDTADNSHGGGMCFGCAIGTNVPFGFELSTGGLFLDGHTGYAYANNTGAVTYSATIPVANIAAGDAISSATGGSGTGTVTCASATCTNLRGNYTVAGGTFTTGTLLALVWPTTTTAYVCSASVLNNATGASIGYHSIATATGMNITSLTSALGLSVDIDYTCTP
jgi:hypothetical protein